MKTVSEWKSALHTPQMLDRLAGLYCCDTAAAVGYADRFAALCDGYIACFGQSEQLALFSTPGRTEIGGNHTDHQHGRVLAGSVNLDVIAAVALNGENIVRVQSVGHALDTVCLDTLEPQAAERGNSSAIVRGMAAEFTRRGANVQGFNAYTTSNVLTGSGLSSSAAFEVLLGAVMNRLFHAGKATAVEIAQMGQRTENKYFGKPCGLMDQTACSVGSMITIDFADPAAPVVEAIPFDFAATGYALCILDSGASHADLTDEYAAIPAEMKAVAKLLGKELLREVPEADFYANLPMLRAKAGDRAVLRAMHFFADNARVAEQVQALKDNDFQRFLALVNESGNSSWLYLQNVTPAGYKEHQDVALTLALARRLLAGQGACRVHGGGFAGTVQAFVPMELLSDFVAGAEAVLGKNACHVLSIRAEGSVEL